MSGKATTAAPKAMARWWKGRHAVLRRPCPPGVRVQVPPWSLTVALVVKRRSWLPPKEQVQVRFLAGVLVGECPRGVPVARDPAKVEGEVRLLTGILAQRPPCWW